MNTDKKVKTKAKTYSPSLTMSLLSQGNNGSFSKPFARKHGLYAAVLLSELIYLQDLFIHKQGKQIEAEGLSGFFRSYEDLHIATSIPLDTLRRQTKITNPLNILRKLGILKSAKTTIGDSFKRIIIYRVDQDAVHQEVAIATEEYYKHIVEKSENTRKQNEDAEEAYMILDSSKQKVVTLKQNSEKTAEKEAKNSENMPNEPKSEKSQTAHSLSCAKHTTVESKGLESTKSINTPKINENEEDTNLPPYAQSSLQVMRKAHLSNNTNRGAEQTNLTTNSTNQSLEEPEARVGEKAEDEAEAIVHDQNKEMDFPDDVVSALYQNKKGLYLEETTGFIDDYTEGSISEEALFKHLASIAKLPSYFKLSTKDASLMEKLKHITIGTDIIAAKLLRNAVLIECDKRRKAFGQLFVGLDSWI